MKARGEEGTDGTAPSSSPLAFQWFVLFVIFVLFLLTWCSPSSFEILPLTIDMKMVSNALALSNVSWSASFEIFLLFFASHDWGSLLISDSKHACPFNTASQSVFPILFMVRLIISNVEDSLNLLKLCCCCRTSFLLSPVKFRFFEPSAQIQKGLTLFISLYFSFDYIYTAPSHFWINTHSLRSIWHIVLDAALFQCFHKCFSLCFLLTCFHTSPL